MVFFFNDPATTEIYTLSLHDALPISQAELNAFVINSRKYSFSKYEYTRKENNVSLVGFDEVEVTGEGEVLVNELII